MGRNPNYWGGAQPWASVTTRFMRSPASRVVARLSGDVNLIDALPTSDVNRVERDSRTQVSRTVSNRNMYVFVDHLERQVAFVRDRQGQPLERNSFRNLRAREAVNLAINREAIVSRVMDGAAEPTGQFMPRDWFGWTPGMTPVHDPSEARRLLAGAGFPNGFTAPPTVMSMTSAPARHAARC